MRSTRATLADCQKRVIACRLCPRLVKWREKVAVEKRRAFAHEEYWGKPLPGWGDPKARLLVVGLAPAAHGGNRTGRMFTGDESGNWLYRALCGAGFASQPEAIRRDDGLRLIGAYITAIVRCAPPGNKPTTAERDNCLPYLIEELRRLSRVRVIVALGHYAHDNLARALRQADLATEKTPTFSHGAESRMGPYTILDSYHPSQQNTNTHLLTRDMLGAVFQRARGLVDQES
jgi:uracil-DNA glycosylase family 4